MVTLSVSCKRLVALAIG